MKNRGTNDEKRSLVRGDFMTEYAMYKGDKFIDIDTIHNLSEKYHKTESELKYLSYPSAHKRSHGNSLLLYKRTGQRLS